MNKLLLSFIAFALSTTINISEIENETDIYAKGSDVIEATELILVDGETETEITEFPYSLESLEEKTYTLKSGENTYNLHVDNTAPVISCSVEDKTYKEANVKIEIEGAEKQKITLNGEEKGNEFSVKENGTYELKITAEDNVGNTASLERTFKVYNTAPVIKITGIDRTIKNEDYKISVNVTSDIEVETKITLDGNEVNSPITVSEEGEHTLIVKATDILGNESTETKTFKIDKSSPEINIEGLDKTSYNTDVTYKITGADSVRINAQDAEAEGTLSKEGRYVLIASATNEAGTTTTITKEFKIDKSAPDLTITGIDKTNFNTDVKYEVKSNEGTVSVKINGHESDVKGTLKEEGIYALTAEAVDDAGNMASFTKEFIIDKTAPEVTIEGVKDGYYNTDIVFKVLSTDDFVITLDGKKIEPGVITKEGDHILVVTSTDLAGNTAEKTVKFTIDKTVPTISFNDVNYVTDLRDVKSFVQDNNLTSVSMKAVCKDKTLNASGTESEINLKKDDTDNAESDSWLFTVTAIDKAGNKTESKKTIIRDTVNPKITLSEVSKYVNKDVNMVAEIKDSNESESVMTINHNGKERKVKGFAKIKKVLSDEGNYEITVDSIDKAGNKSSKTKSFIIDKTNPKVTLTTSNGHVRSARSANVQSSENGATYIKVTLDGKTIFNKRASSYSDFSKNGVYKVSAYAVDLAGNKSTVKTNEFTVDNISPNISLTGAKQGQYYNRAVTLNASVKERFYEGTKVDISGTIEKHGNISIPFKCTGVKTKVSKTFKQNGIYHIKMTAKDKAGNTASTKELSFVIDTTNPEIVISTPENGGYDSVIAPTVKITDDFFDSKNISLTNEEGKYYKDNFGKTGGTRTYSDFKRVKENDGIYTITVSAKDLAGNSKSASKVFIVNRFGSKFKVKKKPDEYSKDPSSDVVIEETNISGIKDFKCMVSKDASEFKAEDVKTKTKDQTVTYTIPKSNFSEEGVYKVYVETLDNTGNTSKSKDDFSFTIDKTPPVITYTGLENGKSYAEKRVRLNVSAQDSLSKEVVIKVSADGKNMEIQQDEQGSFANIGEGYNQNIVIAATDKAGNTSKVDIEKVSISTSKFSFFVTHKLLAIAAAVLASLLGLLIFAARKRKKDDGDDLVI